jgi:Type IV secretion-system coupling protein DNA-binding domain
MKTIYRSRNNEANIPRGTQVIYYEDWAIATGFGFVLTFTALMFAAIKLGELVGLPADTWHAGIKSGFTYFDLALSCLVAWRFGRGVKPQKLNQTRGAVLYEDREIGGDGFKALKEFLDNEFEHQPGKAAPLVLAAPKGVDLLQVKGNLPHKLRLLDRLMGRKGPNHNTLFSQCIPLSDDRSRTHILVVGGTGTGKSLTLKPIFHQAIQLRHKLVVLDKKGEYLAEVASKHFFMMGFHDRRQVKWIPGRDIRNIPAALQFIEGVIPSPEGDKIWSDAAKLSSVAIMAHLINTKPLEWDWTDFQELYLLPNEELANLCKVSYPEAYKIFTSAENTISSVMFNLATYLAPLMSFAREWEGSDYPEFSFTEWLDDPAPERNCLIFQTGGYSAQNDPMFRGCLNMIAGYIDSDRYLEWSRKHNVPLWFFCDEFQSFGNLAQFLNAILERGRDRGARLCIGVQDIAQLKEVYSENLVTTLMSSVGVSILAGANQGETTEIYSKNIGELSFTKKHITHSESGKSHDEQEHDELVLTPAEIIDKMGFTHGRTRVLYRFSRNKNVYIVQQPPISFPQLSKLYEPADWVLGIPKVKTTKPGATAVLPVAGAAGGVASKASAQEIEQMLNEELPDEIDELPPGWEEIPDQAGGEDEPYHLDMDEMASPVASLAGASAIEHTLALIDLLAQEKPKLKSAKTIEEIRQEVRRELTQLTR